MSVDISNIEVDVDAIESVQDSNMIIIGTAIGQLVEARDAKRLLALRLKLVDELLDDAAEMDIPDVRSRRIKGDQWKIGAAMHHMNDEAVVKYLQDHFWDGAQYTSPKWTGSDK